MLRLHSHSSRSYPGKPASQAFRKKGAESGNSCCKGAGVSRGHSRKRFHHSWRCGGWGRKTPGYPINAISPEYKIIKPG